MKQSQLQKQFIKSILIAIASALLTLLFHFVNKKIVSHPITRMENSIYDLTFKFRDHNTNFKLLKPDDLVIVDIDDASIKELGRVNSWPRLYDARVIRYIGQGRPYLIGVDFLYTEPDTLPNIYKELLEQNGVKDSDRALQSLSTDDSLAAAIESAQVVYLTAFRGVTESEAVDLSDDEKKDLRLITLPKTKDIDFSFAGSLTLPIKKLREKALGIGSIDQPTDPDGMVRNYKLLSIADHHTGDSIKLFGNFPLYMWSDLIGADTRQFTLNKSKLMLMDSVYVPLNNQGSFRINWMGTKDKIRSISYYKVLNESVPAEYFKDKVVFLGTSAIGMQDLKSVPNSDDRMPGVEVHANAFLNMVNQAYITEKSIWRFLPILLLIAFLTALMINFIKPLYALLLLGLLLILEFASIFPIFIGSNVMFPIVHLFIATITSGMITNAYNYFTEQKQKRQLKNAFGTYVSTTVVNKIIEDPKSLMLGGTKKNLSVLFSDIRGFTKYSEHMDPQLVVSIINKYLSMMSEPVLAHEGTIDKFIGDAIFAIFGAPLDNSDHATEASEVALEMIGKLKDVNEYLVSEGFGPLKIGIGVNTGEMTIGNIGSEKRFDYTAIGDSVNLGSRIEGLTKHFNVNILVSEFTKAACQQDQFIYRELPRTRVQGKQKSVGIFELIDFAKNRKLYEPDITTWEQAHAAFVNRDFGKAISLFEQYKANHPQDVSVDIFLEKCKRYTDFPEEYTDSIDMDTK